MIVPRISTALCARFAALLAFAFLATSLQAAPAKDARLPEVDSPAGLKPGMTGLLKSPKGMRYFLRVPKRYNATTGARLIVFLHGSSMNGLDYLRSFEAKKWCEDDLLCCPNGENGTDPYGQNNFGFESGPLVADVTQQVQSAFKTTVTYVGGHSQGAFLTYNVILNYPALYRGAFPMAGDCWIQNEPNLWEDKPEVLARQKEIAIAVIHGKADPVVQFSQGEHAYDCFRAMGWTKLRLFAPPALNHMFMLAPIDEAIEWLDTVNGLNERKALTLTTKWSREGEWGWVWHAAKAPKPNVQLQRAAEDAATKAAAAMTAAIKAAPAEWIPKWMEFWRIHGETNAAKPLIDTYGKQRDEQRANAVQLFNEAQGLFRASKPADAYKVLEKLRDENPSTYQACFAQKWLGERK